MVRYSLFLPVLAGAIFALIPGSLAAQEKQLSGVAKLPALPQWVENYAIDPSLPTPEDPAPGEIWYLMADRQINAANAEEYYRFAYRFVSQTGMENHSQLTINFDPSYQSLRFHRLQIHRDGEIIDRLPSQQFKVVQREAGHERNLYDGRLSAIVLLQDIRVGDVLDYAYSFQGDNPVFDGHFSHSEVVRWSSPVHRSRFRILWEKERPVAVRSHGGEVDMIRRDSGDFREVLINEDSVTAVTNDDGLPSYYYSRPWVDFSDYGSWATVAKWACKQYDLDQEIPADLAAELERIATLESKEEKVLAALRWTQDEIRYLGIFDGMHSHRPYPLKTILERRHGDCKDKSTTLTTILRRLGFEAYPALVATRSRHSIAEWLPDPTSFDHLIVNLKLDGRDYWLDPTGSFERAKLQNQYTPAYGYALVVDEDTTELTEVKPSGFESSRIDITETFTMDDFSGNVSLTVVSRYFGREASSVRSTFASDSLESMQKSYLDFYSADFPSIEAMAPIEVEDSDDTDSFVTTERYAIEGAWVDSEEDKDRMEFETYARSLAGRIRRPSSRIRTMPYAIAHPVNFSQRIVTEFPVVLNLESNETRVTNPAFEFSFKETEDGKRLELLYEFSSKADAVDPEKMAQYIVDTDKVRDVLSYYVWVPTSFRGKSISEIEANDLVNGVAGDGYRLNWMLVMFVLMMLVIGTVAGWFLYRWDPEPMSPPDPWRDDLVGISGWLGLIAIGVVIRPLVTLFSIYVSIEEWDSSSWAAVGDPSSESYHLLWQPTVILELAFYCGFLVLDILIFATFFKKRTSLPKFEIGYYAFWIATAFITLVLFSRIEGFDPDVKTEYVADLRRSVLQSAIWVPYFIVSKRVRCTFVNRRNAA